MSRFGRSEFLRIDRAARTASWRCCSLVRGLPRRERRSHAIEANAMTVAIARTVHPYVGMNQFYELVASDLTCGRSVVCSEFLYLVKGGPSARRRVSAGPRVRPGGRSRPGARGVARPGQYRTNPAATARRRRARHPAGHQRAGPHRPIGHQGAGDTPSPPLPQHSRAHGVTAQPPSQYSSSDH